MAGRVTTHAVSEVVVADVQIAVTAEEFASAAKPLEVPNRYLTLVTTGALTG